ncbi:MAG: Xaa-Pro peptidase family protein, partial [Muribaculaceae bacterium]|nr:Xaa-Pro peptidase family protein [Muribaculaceae bacterium]
MNEELLLLDKAEAKLRQSSVRMQMIVAGASAVLVRDFANVYYLTGRVFDGYVYLPAEGEPIYFVKRPVHLAGANVVSISKPENMAEHVDLSGNIALELDTLSYSAVVRLCKAMSIAAVRINASAIMRNARAVKTAREQDTIRLDGIKHECVYGVIPKLYREGMTDVELQIEIERVARLEGSLGQFRISGDTMELYMGNLLAGDNADAPSPYDFAMGGAGLDPSLPVGADGTVIKPGMSVMVDMNGNFNGYMTDMTRTYALGKLADKAVDAHNLSIEICHTLSSIAAPGMQAKELYEEACRIVSAHGLERYFMGHSQHAGFIGHGVGIEINELPVIAPRSRDILAKGNVIALEPKFVIPGTGAVGIENTYTLTDAGLEPLTKA